MKRSKHYGSVSAAIAIALGIGGSARGQVCDLICPGTDICAAVNANCPPQDVCASARAGCLREPTPADLAGSWQAALLWSGSGCGPMSGLVNFTLDSTGSTSSAVLTTHGDCGDNTLSGQTFRIDTLNSNGSGTASLSCGPSCGWGFTIQLDPLLTTFNLVDVAPTNPWNYVAGTAIRQR
jgi:hypothetical protein